MITDMKAAAGALGAKTARACDSCLRRRARWFCGADDAFLCHGCDNLVHSANQLARRHERVRLQAASCKVVTTTAQAWHSGFTRKARTPRHNKHFALQQRLKDQVLFNSTCVLPVVPELGVEEPLLDAADESEEQLLCRVPVFDPFDAELCSVYNEVKNHAGGEGGCDLDNFSEFLPSDMDLAEFAADVETLLGSGIDEDSSPGDVKKGSSESEVVIFGCKEDQGAVRDACVQGEGAKSTAAMVKVEDEEEEEEEEELDADTACHLESVLDMTSDAFDWNIESVLSPSLEEEEKTAVPAAKAASTNGSDVVGDEVRTKRDIFLRLNYEDVITAWASQGCPWTTGNPPKFNSDIDDCWPNFLDPSGADVQFSSYGGVRSLRGQIVGGGDGGREARVSRYREKRRTRLFAKKIRYEVRKLNAEKRPRMKGRFVKRACFVGANNNAAAFPAYH